MNAREQCNLGDLFKFVCDEGVRWLFVILPDDQWAITSNGERVASGTGERRSLKAGVDKFMALTHPLHGVTVCDPVIQEHLDRIQRDIRRGGDRKGMIGGTPALAHLSSTHGQLPRSFAKPRTGGLK